MRCRYLHWAVVGAAVFFFQPPLFAHGTLSEQIAGVTATIAREPSNAALRVRRAELYSTAREYTLALADLDTAAALDPRMASIDLVRAHVLLDGGRPGAAAASATRFLATQPRHPGALLVRARARAVLGRGDEAVRDLTAALQVHPTPDLYIERAKVVLALSGSEQALRGIDEGIDRLGPIVTLELEGIDLESRVGRVDRALARLDRVAAQAARKESWLERRGALLESAGRLDDARTAYRAALVAATRLPAWSQRAAATSSLITRLKAAVARLDQHATPHPRTDHGGGL